MKKRLHFVLGTVLTMMVFSSLTFASEWKQEVDGRWWYQHDDGSYTTNNWELINGKYYYFDAQGWMLANTTTPDGKYVGSDGAWVMNGLDASTSMESLSQTASTISTDLPAEGYNIIPYNLLPYSTYATFKGSRSSSTTKYTVTSAKTYAGSNGGLRIKFKYKAETTGDTPSLTLIRYAFLNEYNQAVYSMSFAVFEADSIGTTAYGSYEFEIPEKNLPKGTYKLRVYSD